MLRLSEEGLLPEQIKIIPDWQVNAAICAFHLVSLAMSARIIWGFVKAIASH